MPIVQLVLLALLVLLVPLVLRVLLVPLVLLVLLGRARARAPSQHRFSSSPRSRGHGDGVRLR